MSKLTELLDELCPDGVEYRPFSEVIERLRTGLNPRKNFILNSPGSKNYYITVRELGGFNIETTEKTDLVNDAGLQLIQNRSGLRKGDVLFSGTGTIGRTALVSTEPKDWNIKEGVYALTPDHSILDSRFLVYALNSSRFQNAVHARAAGGTVKSISMKNLSALTLPVPPLEVQQEIVRVLDAFTDLEQSLVSELELRKKQFSYIRSTLVSSKNREMTTLGGISRNLDSRRVPITQRDRVTGEIPYYGASGIVDYVSDYIFDGDYLLVSEDGANLKTRVSPIAFSVSGKSWVNNHAHVLEFDSYAARRFAEHYINDSDIGAFVSGGAQPKFNQKNLSVFPIPVYSDWEKESLVSKLDAFEALIQSIEREIVLRRRQYEFYRDELLSFTSKEV